MCGVLALLQWNLIEKIAIMICLLNANRSHINANLMEIIINAMIAWLDSCDLLCLLAHLLALFHAVTIAFIYFIFKIFMIENSNVLMFFLLEFESSQKIILIIGLLPNHHDFIIYHAVNEYSRESFAFCYLYLHFHRCSAY